MSSTTFLSCTPAFCADASALSEFILRRGCAAFASILAITHLAGVVFEAVAVRAGCVRRGPANWPGHGPDGQAPRKGGR